MEKLYITSFLIGLLGNMHCLGMCGGIIGMLALNTKKNIVTCQIFYNTGRIVSYIGVCVILYLISTSSNKIIGVFTNHILKIISGIFLIILGLHINKWTNIFNTLEKIGFIFWKNVALAKKHTFDKEKNASYFKLGLMWGLLPCGLVYSNIALCIASQSIQNSLIATISFGLGTLPAILTGSFLSIKIINNKKLKIIKFLISLIIIILGFSQIFSTITDTNSCH